MSRPESHGIWMAGMAVFVAIQPPIPIVLGHTPIQGRRLQRNAFLNGSRLIVVAAAQNLITFLPVSTVSMPLARSNLPLTPTLQHFLKTAQDSIVGICRQQPFASGLMKKCFSKK